MSYFLNIRFYTLLIIFTVAGFAKSPAQSRLTLEEAVRIALEKNYNIKLVSNNLQINKNDLDYALPALLPRVTGNLSTNNNIQNTEQTLRSTGNSESRNDAKNSSTSYGVNLNWLVFDGFAMFARFDQLKEFQKLGESNLRLTVLNTISDVVTTYYDLVQQQKQINATDTALGISRFRVKTAQTRFKMGKASRLEVLAARVDLNTDTTNLLRQKDTFRRTQISLNELLARNVNAVFTVTDSIGIDKSLDLKTLSDHAGKQNPTLQSSLISRRIAELNLSQVKASRYPSVSVFSGYNFNRSKSELSFATQSKGQGFNYGLTGTLNIFGGLQQRKNEKNAALEIENAVIDYQRISGNINSQLFSLFHNYITNLELVKLEEANQKIAKQNLDITLEKFRLGSIAPIEFREAQRNFVEATVRFSNAQYQAKIAEISLKEIAGNQRL